MDEQVPGQEPVTILLSDLLKVLQEVVDEVADVAHWEMAKIFFRFEADEAQNTIRVFFVKDGPVAMEFDLRRYVATILDKNGRALGTDPIQSLEYVRGRWSFVTRRMYASYLLGPNTLIATREEISNLARGAIQDLVLSGKVPVTAGFPRGQASVEQVPDMEDSYSDEVETRDGRTPRPAPSFIRRPGFRTPPTGRLRPRRSR